MDSVWEGTIPVTFDGYVGSRAYELSDGTRWRQECATAEYVYREWPEAV